MTNTQPRPFDERAALEELERLADRIQATRRQRERAVAEFNAFVKTFKDDDHAARLSALQPAPRVEAPPASSVHAIPSAAPLPPPPVVERRAAEPAAATVSIPNAPPPSSVEPSIDAEPAPASWSSLPARSFDLQALWKSPRGRIGLLVAALVVVVALASWVFRGGQEGGQEGGEPENPVAASPAPAASEQTPPAAAATPAVPTPVASTGAPRAVNVVLTTIRPVWTRVTVDDRKVIEREIPGAQTIPLGADRVIVIRAGDAGAIRVTVDGKDLGALGRDGQIASRTFSAPR